MTFSAGISVQRMLKNRGCMIGKVGDDEQLLIPHEQLHDAQLKEQRDEFTRLLDRSSFRKVLKRVVSRGGEVPLGELDAIAGGAARGYVDLLCQLKICSPSEDSVSPAGQVGNFGPTLEWHVARLCKRHLDCRAIHAVTLEDMPCGGDYDVLAALGGVLMYVEVKTSRPDDIPKRELAHFLWRRQELNPEITVLLVDTDLDLPETSLMESLQEVIDEAKGRVSRGGAVPFVGELRLTPLKHHPKVFRALRGFYTCTSEPSISTQLQRCIRNYHAEVKDRIPWSGPMTLDFEGVSTGSRIDPEESR